MRCRFPSYAMVIVMVVAVPPLNVILPNYNGVAVGEVASLEGGSHPA
jgi:hypothetical protein